MISQIIQCFHEQTSQWVATQFKSKNNTATIRVYKTGEDVSKKIFIREVEGEILCFIRSKK